MLLVDDSLQFTAAAGRFLGLLPRVDVVGYARSGREALDRVYELKPDLVLMDVMMPDMDGLEATRRLKARADAPWVVILTLNDTADYRVRADRVGADGFVSKQDLVTQLPDVIDRLGH